MGLPIIFVKYSFAAVFFLMRMIRWLTNYAALTRGLDNSKIVDSTIISVGCGWIRPTHCNANGVTFDFRTYKP